MGEKAGEGGGEAEGKGRRESISLWEMVWASSIRGEARSDKGARKGLAMAVKIQTEGQVRRIRVSIRGSFLVSIRKDSSKR